MMTVLFTCHLCVCVCLSRWSRPITVARRSPASVSAVTVAMCSESRRKWEQNSSEATWFCWFQHLSSKHNKLCIPPPPAGFPDTHSFWLCLYRNVYVYSRAVYKMTMSSLTCSFSHSHYERSAYTSKNQFLNILLMQQLFSACIPESFNTQNLMHWVNRFI